jgi:hypothetical protein
MLLRPSPHRPVSSRPSRFPRSRGFALIVTVTLMAFLLVLMLTLSVAIKTGAQTTTAAEAETRARQNALVGLNQAIGQLQRFTGHDQRVTAPAEFADGTLVANGSQFRLPNLTLGSVPGGTGGTNPYAQQVTVTNDQAVGLPQNNQLYSGSRFWTGVWGNTRPANESYLKSPKAQLLTWLISGNEFVGYETSTFGGGQITAASQSTAIPFRPDMVVTGLSTTSTYGSTLTIGGTQAVLLVGPASVSVSSTGTLLTLADAFVAAPLTPISISAQLVPGLGGSGSKLDGRTAWWVGDEGVKAKANLQDIYDGYNAMNGTTSANIAARTRMKVAQRVGLEILPGFSDVPTANSISIPVNTSSLSTTSTTSSANLTKVLSLPQLRSLDPTASTLSDGVIRRNYHNLTVNSYGVLSDTLRGGLRIDLTAMFDDGATSTSSVGTSTFSSFYQRRMMNLPILPTNSGASWIDNGDLRLTYLDPSRKDTALDDFTKEISPINNVINNRPTSMPTWDVLKTWYDISKEVTSSSISTVTARIGTASTSTTSGVGLVMAHVAPVLTQARMYVKIFPKQVRTPPASDVTKTYAASYSYNIFVAFALGNPYSASMSLPRLEFSWVAPDFGTYTTSNISYSIWRSPNQANLSTNIAFDTRDLPSGVNVTGGSTQLGLIPRGKSFKQATISNSWNLYGTSVVPGSPLALAITGLNVEPTRDPDRTKQAAMGNFTFVTQPVVIPAGGIVGFQVDPNTATYGAGSTFPGNGLIGTTRTGLTISMTTVNPNSPNTLSNAYYIVESGDLSPITFAPTTSTSSVTTITFGPYLQAGTNLSIYVRPYVAANASTRPAGVYTSLLNHAWISNDVANTPNHGDTFTVSTGGATAPNGVNVGGYRIYIPGPLTPVTTSVSWREDNNNQRINNPFPPYANVLATGPGSGAPITTMTHGNVTTNVPTADNGQGAFRVMADYNLAGQYKVTPWVSTGNGGMPTAPPYAGQYVAGTSSISDIGFNFGNGYHAQRGATDSYSSMFLHWPPVWGPHYFTQLLKSNDSTFTTTSSTQAAVVLFDLPRRSSTTEMPILSMGFLQHANLTADDQYPFVGHQPGNAVGNSSFHPLVSRTMTKQIRPNLYYANNANSTVSNSNQLQAQGTNYFDMSYLLNTALWDRFYFSGIPQVVASDGISVYPSANPRLKFAVGVVPTAAHLAIGSSFSSAQTPTTSDALNPAVALPKEYAPARYLMTDGAFNINSTSIEAWVAVLAGQRKRAATMMASGSSSLSSMITTGSTAFPRTLYQPKYTAGAGETMNTSNFTAYGGFRWLTDAQIYALATTLVQEIRLRGPFVSLAHFINRGGITGTNSATNPLVQVGPELNGNYGGFGNDTWANGTSDPNGRLPGYYYNEANTVQVAGALQMAIDRASIINTASLASQLTGYPAFASSISPPIALTARSNMGVNANGGAQGALSGTAADPNTYGRRPSTPYADALPAVTISTSQTAAPGKGVVLSRAVGIPGWLTQADILQAIGSNLSARSDTFVIRAYGDALDLLNTNPSDVRPQDILARAWCEAVVQRFPDYVDPSDPASAHPSGTASMTVADGGVAVKAVNQAFGRRYRIVSFRWLTKDDI